MTGTAATLLRLELRPAPASGGLLGKNATIGLCLAGSASLCRLVQDMQPCCCAHALHAAHAKQHGHRIPHRLFEQTSALTDTKDRASTQ